MRISRAEAIGLGIIVPKPRSHSKVRLPMSYTQHEAMILGIDPGAVAGWGIVGPRRFRYSAGPDRSQNTVPARLGIATDEQNRSIIVQWAIAEARTYSLPLFVVGETWTFGDPRRDPKAKALMMMGLGAAWRDWDRELRRYRVPQNRILRVNTQRWRADVLKGCGAKTTDEWKLAAQRCVRGRFQDIGDEYPHDAYEGLCIALWGSQSGEVGAKIESLPMWPRKK